MSEIKAIFESIRLNESKSRIIILGAGMGEYEMGYFSFDEKRQVAIMRIKGCHLIDFEDIDWRKIPDAVPNGPYTLDWAKEILGKLPKYHGGEIITGSNDTYESGYVLFTEDRPTQRIEVALDLEEWMAIMDYNEPIYSIYPSGTGDPDARLADAIVINKETSGWNAPMVDQ